MRAIGVIAVILLATSGLGSGQQPVSDRANRPGVIGFMHAIHSTNNI
jgi:hypothetical protein